MSHDDLISKADSLDATAKLIQQGQQPGLTEQEIIQFVDTYHKWYAECLVLLSQPIQRRFREEFDGGVFTPKIKAFLQSPLKVNPLYQRESENLLLSYWQYPYEISFHPFLVNQKQLLREAQKRKDSGEINVAPQSVEDGNSDDKVSSHVNLSLALYDLLNSRGFSFEDIEDISFRMGIDWDSLAGDTKGRKARAIVSYCAKHNQLNNLRSFILKTRPNLADQLK